MTPDLERRLHEHLRKEVEALEYFVKVYRGLADEYESRLAAARERLNISEENEKNPGVVDPGFSVLRLLHFARPLSWRVCFSVHRIL